MEQLKIMGGKYLQMMCNNCSFHSLFDCPTLLSFFWSFAAIVFVCLHVLLKQKVEMLLKMHVYDGASRFNNSPHAANHCIYNVSCLNTQMNPNHFHTATHVPVQTTLKQSWSWGPVPPQPHLWPAVRVSSSSGIQRQPPPQNVHSTVSHLTRKKSREFATI